MKKFGRRADEMPVRMHGAVLVTPSAVPSAQPVPPALPPDESSVAPSASSLFVSAPRYDEPSTHHPVMSASLRERVIEQIEPSVATTVSRDVLRRQIEEIIHGIAN